MSETRFGSALAKPAVWTTSFKDDEPRPQIHSSGQYNPQKTAGNVNHFISDPFLKQHSRDLRSAAPKGSRKLLIGLQCCVHAERNFSEDSHPELVGRNLPEARIPKMKYKNHGRSQTGSCYAHDPG